MPFSPVKLRAKKPAKPGDDAIKAGSSERRVQPRFTTQFRSTFTHLQQESQGRTLDLSLSGCKIESGAAVTQGLAFECRLHIPGFNWPLRVDEAVVRWVAGNTFGLEFTRLHPEEEDKLKTVIQNLEQEN